MFVCAAPVMSRSVTASSPRSARSSSVVSISRCLVRAPASRRRSVGLCSGIRRRYSRKCLKKLLVSAMINQAIDFPMISGHHSISIPHRPLARLRALRPGPELLFFAAAYLLYIGARWVFAGDPRTAIDHADSIIALERSTHIAVEGSVQRAFEAGTISWLLSNVYMAAQLVV